MFDREILDIGHGGYSITTRFTERYIEVSPPEGASEQPTVAEMTALHPYLSRFAGPRVRRVWVAAVTKGNESVEEAVRLAFVYRNEMRDQDEALLVRNLPQLIAWIGATRRRRENR